MSVTWRELGDRLRAELSAAGLDTPEIDARRIVEEASGCDGADHHAVRDEPAPARGVAAAEAMAARRREGEPLQYVVGRWGFRTLDLFVDGRVLIPRPETEAVVGWAIDEIDRSGAERPTVVDLGTGSGAIALSVAVERPAVQVWATDRSRAALDVARANLAGAGQAAARVTLAEGSWFEALPDGLLGAFDLVVSNPPYVAAGDELPAVVAEWEPTDSLIAGPDGLEAVSAILGGVARWLRPGGAVVIELAPHQAERAAAVAAEVGLVDATRRPDLAGRDRALVARRPS